MFLKHFSAYSKMQAKGFVNGVILGNVSIGKGRKDDSKN